MAIGDPLSLVVRGTAVTDDSGNAPPVDGWVATVRFEGMGRRNPATDPIADGAGLYIVVEDPGFDTDGNPTTVQRTIRGTAPLRNTWPPTWTSIGLATVVPPQRWCCDGALNVNLYYTAAGGIRGTGSPSTDTGITWTLQTDGVLPGYIETVAGSDVDVHFGLDDFIYDGSTLISWGVDAVMYEVGGVQSTTRASGSANMTNSSALAYDRPAAAIITPAHQRSTGSIRFEMIPAHNWPMNGQTVACVKMQAGNSAWSTTDSEIVISSPSLSQEPSVSDLSVECFGDTIPTAAIADGDVFIRYKIYPWLGDLIFDSSIHGEGAQIVIGSRYAVINSVWRNASNYYYLTVVGGGNVSDLPTGTGTYVGADGYTWVFFGSDTSKVNSANPQERYHFNNDVAGLYKRGWAVANGTGSNVGSPIVHTTEAAALAAKATDSFGTVQAAAVAGQTYNNTAGGGLTTHNDTGGLTVFRLAGTHSGFSGGTSLGTSTNIGKEWLYVKNDPAAAPGTVILGYNATLNSRACATRHWDEGFTATDTTGAIIDPATDAATALAQPVTELVVIGCNRAGSGASSNLVGRVGVTSYYGCTFTGGARFQTGGGRACDVALFGNSITGPTLINVKAAAGNRVVLTGALASPPFGDASTQYLPARMTWVVTDNWVTGSPASGTSLMTALNGGVNNLNPYMGALVSGNILECLVDPGAGMRLAADGSTGNMISVAAFNNTIIGERANDGYNDQAQTPLRTKWRYGNNIFQTMNTVSDTMAHSGSTKGAGRFNSLANQYRVGFFSNASFEGAGTGQGFLASQDKGNTTAPMAFGRNTSYAAFPAKAAQSAQFVDDKSANKTGSGGNVGGGDYHPATGAVAIGFTITQTRKYDLSGALRAANGAVGGYAATGESGGGGGGTMSRRWRSRQRGRG